MQRERDATMANEPERSDASMDAASGYRFDRLKTGLVLRDMYFTRKDPRPGDRIGDFDLPTLDGGRFRFDDSRRDRPGAPRVRLVHLPP